jgi:hypothetical protein
VSWKVCLCARCIEELDEYYPYLVPREELEITEVPLEECDNYGPNLNKYNERLEARNCGS